MTSVQNRFITPNGDGKNDQVTFFLANPQFFDITGKIYDLRGKLVASMTATTNFSSGSTSLQWNGKANNAAVRGGAYIYVISAEDKTFSGTVAVIR